MGANKIKELWQFFLSQTKSVWVFILGNTWSNKMSNPKRIGLKERPRRTPAARELSQRSREHRAPSCQRKAAKNAGGLSGEGQAVLCVQTANRRVSPDLARHGSGCPVLGSLVPSGPGPAHPAWSPDWLRAQRPCLENPNMVTHGLRLAR